MHCCCKVRVVKNSCAWSLSVPLGRVVLAMSPPWQSYPWGGGNLSEVGEEGAAPAIWRGCHWLFIQRSVMWQNCIGAVSRVWAPPSHTGEGWSWMACLQALLWGMVGWPCLVVTPHILWHLLILQRTLHRESGFSLPLCAKGIPHTRLQRARMISSIMITKTIADSACRPPAVVVKDKWRYCGKTYHKG